MNIRSILSPIMGLIKHKGAMGSVEDQIATIFDYFSSECRRGKLERLYLLVHNIDGCSMRSEKIQSMLCVFGSCKNIHLIASVDHINASIMWDHTKMIHFNWTWHCVTNYEPYIEETTFENSILMKSTVLGNTGAAYVLDSLPPSSKEVYLKAFVIHYRFSRYWLNIKWKTWMKLKKECHILACIN
jgi:origin recognition complex subunit 2